MCKGTQERRLHVSNNDMEAAVLELTDSVAEARRREERKAFDELVERYHRQAYNIAYRMTGNSADAEDLVQEAFIRAYRFFGQYRRDMPFENWLYRIISNVFVDSLRKRPKARIRSLDEPIVTSEGDAPFEVADRGPGPEDNVLTKDLDTRIQEALAMLPEFFRLAVIYADIEGLSYEEIAEVMGTSIGTVRSRIHRGRSLLRDKLKVYRDLMGE